MAHRKTERNPLFAGRWFEDDIILLCLRWYFRFKLSYRDLVEILGERGLPISHTTILRWVVRYAEICERRWSRFERPVGGSWRVDETFIKVWGQWMYLYRAVDGQGNTVEFFLSRARGIAAAKAFFRKALKHHREPHSIPLDGPRPSHSALRHMGMNGEFNFRGRKPGEDSLLSIPVEDVEHSRPELRFHALGVTNSGRQLHVTFTLRGENTKIRVISARDIASQGAIPL